MTRFSNYRWAISLAITFFGWVWVMAGTRAATGQRLDNIDQQINLVQNQSNTTKDGLNNIQTSLAQIQTDVQWIRQEVLRLRNHQR